MADLVVDLGLLESTARSLGVLADEFKDASAVVSASQDDIGVPVLLAALEKFSTDWRVHRQQLVNSIQDVRTLAAEGAKQYTATDHRLARAQRTGDGR